MENSLSQADIDALMRALLPANGEDLFGGKGGQIRPYDFRRPTKFSKDMLRTLVFVHDNFARLLQNFFLANLRLQVQVHVQHSSQYSYSEYTQLLPSPSVVATLQLNPLPGLCLMEVSQNVAFALLDRVFGGSGSDAQPERGLSEIEVAVMQRMISDLLSPLSEAWRNIAEISPSVSGMETNPIFLQTSAPSEVLAVVTLSMQIGEHMGHIGIAMPYATVEQVLTKPGASWWLSPSDPVPAEGGTALHSSLQDAPVQVRVGLGQSRITVAEFADLKLGDLILLNSRTDAEVPVYIGNSLTYLGRPGIVGNRMSVQIQRRATRVG